MSTEPATAAAAKAKDAGNTAAGKEVRSPTSTRGAATRGRTSARGASTGGNSPSGKAAARSGGALARGGTTKISVTVPTEVLAEVRDLGPDNLSAVVADALRQWSASARLGRLLDELDAVYGLVPADVAADVEAEWGPIFDRSAARTEDGPRA